MSHKTQIKNQQRYNTVEGSEIAFHHHNCNNCNHFQNAPVSIWEEDFSEVKEYIDNLKKIGVTDFEEHFAHYTEDILSLVQKVKVVQVNEATLRIFKAKNEEELYRGLNTVFNKDSFDIFRKELIALSQGETEFISEAVNLTLRGDQINVLLKLSVPPGYENTLSRVFVSIIDISDLKRLEAKVKEAEGKYKKVFQEAPDVIMIIDGKTGIVRETNNKAEELLGLPVDEIVGMHFMQLFPREESGHYKHLFKEHMQKGRFASERLVVCHRSGQKIPVSISSGILELRGRKCISVIFRQLEKTAQELLLIKSDDSPCHQLTKREREILKLIGSGLSARQIADKIYLSEHTVITHRKRIMKKLNMHKSTDLVRYAVDCGMIDDKLSLT